MQACVIEGNFPPQCVPGSSTHIAHTLTGQPPPRQSVPPSAVLSSATLCHMVPCCFSHIQLRSRWRTVEKGKTTVLTDIRPRLILENGAYSLLWRARENYCSYGGLLRLRPKTEDKPLSLRAASLFLAILLSSQYVATRAHTLEVASSSCTCFLKLCAHICFCRQSPPPQTHPLSLARSH